MSDYALYRVELTDLGEDVELQPYIPRRASVREDRLNPRIPVCAEIDQCLISITTLHLPSNGKAFVYQAVDPDSIDFDSPNILVPDWEDTEEIWITEPCRFLKQGEIEVQASLANDPEIQWRWSAETDWRVAKQ